MIPDEELTPLDELMDKLEKLYTGEIIYAMNINEVIYSICKELKSLKENNARPVRSKTNRVSK